MGRTFLLGVAGLAIALPHAAFSQATIKGSVPESLVRKLSVNCDYVTFRLKDESFSDCLTRNLEIDRSRDAIPSAVFIKFADYPVKALAEKRAGISLLKLSINEAGQLLGCSVSKTSGHVDLDERACAIIMERGKFSPATDSYETPISSNLEYQVAWRFDLTPQNSVHRGGTISGEDYPPQMIREKKSGTVVVTFTINDFGRVENCKATTSSGHTELDEESCKLVNRRFRFKPALDQMGSPVNEIKSQRINWAIPNTPSLPSSDEILSKAAARCSFIGYKAGSKKYQECLSEQIRLMSK